MPPERGMKRPDFLEVLRREMPRLTEGFPPWANVSRYRDLVVTRWDVGYYDVPEEPNRSTVRPVVTQ